MSEKVVRLVRLSNTLTWFRNDNLLTSLLREKKNKNSESWVQKTRILRRSVRIVEKIDIVDALKQLSKTSRRNQEEVEREREDNK